MLKLHFLDYVYLRFTKIAIFIEKIANIAQKC